MAERRKTNRRYLLYYVRVYDARKSDQIGHLVDITPKGAMVITERPVPAGQTFRLKLELTADISEKAYLEFSATSVWCRPDIDPQYFNTGYEILSLEPGDQEIIEKIVQVYGFRENQAPTAKPG